MDDWRGSPEAAGQGSSGQSSLGGHTRLRPVGQQGMGCLGCVTDWTSSSLLLAVC